MIEVKVKTVIRNINIDTEVQPTAPCFRFVNNGDVTVFINNFPVEPRTSIGDDSSVIMAVLWQRDKHIKIIRQEQYKITFASNIGLDAPIAASGRTDARRALALIETFYEIEEA